MLYKSFALMAALAVLLASLRGRVAYDDLAMVQLADRCINNYACYLTLYTV